MSDYITVISGSIGTDIPPDVEVLKSSTILFKKLIIHSPQTGSLDSDAH